MGNHIQSILIRPASLDGGADKLLADLGYERRRKIEDVSFTRAGGGSIWIGSINGCVVIHTYLAAAIIEKTGEEDRDVVELRTALARRFPDADIVVLFYNSVVEGWGFAIIRNGVLIRRQHGYDGMIECDEGPRLPIEEDFFSKFQRIETSDGVEYKYPDHPEYDNMTEANLGGELVQEIGCYYTGSSFDTLDILGASFWVDNDEADHLERVRQAPQKSQTKPWWKFWG